nr:helix-turn-helix domain containing protein [uncultured Lachnoanaerobaculum sp.]
MKEENDYSPRRGWSMEEIATLSELKAKGTKIVKIAETLNRKSVSVSAKIKFMGTDLYDKEAWKNYTSRTLPWTKEELRIVKEIMENGGDAKNAALRVPHSPNEIYRKMSFMGKDFFDEGTWDKYAID